MEERRSDGESAAKEAMEVVDRYMHNYPINIAFPANVEVASPPSLVGAAVGASVSGTKERPLLTDIEFVQHRLLESGLLFEADLGVGDACIATEKFINDLEQSGCYDGIHVEFRKREPSHLGSAQQESTGREIVAQAVSKSRQPLPVTANVRLQEKKWYKLYVGGGIKHDSGKDGNVLQSFENGLPKVQFETSASLLNLKGRTDKTSLSYSVDQASTSSVSLCNDAPLYTLFPDDSAIQSAILLSDDGSKKHASIRAFKDTIDFQRSRSYTEFQRALSVRISNIGNVAPQFADGPWKCVDWSATWRDLIPRRHPTAPYACDASPEVVVQAGPSLKHSLSCEYRLNGSSCNDRFSPTEGYDGSCTVELAGPPGDVGFWKIAGGVSHHQPVLSSLADDVSLHISLQAGIMRALNFGGLCKNITSIQDRFFVGGPLQLRGFQPAGIGSRANKGGASAPGGDALGGEIFHASTLAASAPFPFIDMLRRNGVRLMFFANTGSLSGWGVPTIAMFQSTRAAVGAGIYCGTSMGKIELTYAVPLRYGPKDVRRSFQLGIGLDIG